ncbi:putative malate transport protein (putative) [Levilactobacillus namurensis DSM 19117]|uniref:Putative malate transport protein (Putative) n=1 Tax=Levilactobacillus namurensis DSM 19117 TaxID=1423773 RepID=A0A0R1JV12_9LACO|nr:AEC family transporter [Levilactobacillus namurensis]KRK74872.1 putative malate transport protein (putative) [Levilactobacillus namurensis DSM 19117]GEO75281.1 transporter [Levilactobacillus namurensis]
MQLTQLTAQIILMFGLMLIGVLINKCHLMHAQTANDLTNILLYVVSPCLIINAFEQPFSGSRMHQFLLAALATLLWYLVVTGLAWAIFGHLKDPNLRRITQYGSIYSNAGFMGIPLISALFGSTGVFYAVVALAGFNLFSWTLGVRLFHNQTSHQVRQVLLNPNIIAIAVGLLLFLTSWHLPTTLNRIVQAVGSVNTPLSMIVIGNSLAQIHLSRQMLNPWLGLTLLLRNLLFPLIGAGLLTLLGVSGIAYTTTLIMIACPVAGIVVLFTLQIHADAAPAIAVMSLSTVLSLVTIPLVVALGAH